MLFCEYTKNSIGNKYSNILVKKYLKYEYLKFEYKKVLKIEIFLFQ